MALERQTSKPEIASQKRSIKLAPAIGDWTTYKPPKVLAKRVKTGLYGFDRLSREELNQVLLVHYRFIQDLAKRFKIDLGLATEIFSAQVEQTNYLNFLRTLSGQLVQCKIKVAELHDPIFLFIELPLANSIINYALGSVDLEPINRSLTEAETATLTAALSQYLPAFSTAFAGAVKDADLTVVSSPDVVMDPTVNPTSTFVSFNAELSLADNPTGRIYFSYAGGLLKKLLENFRKKEQSKPLDFSRLPAALLSKINCNFTATLGETTLTTDELHQFEVGDVVSLETTINSPVPALVGATLELSCQPGTKEKKAAVRVVGLQEATEIELPPPELAAEEQPATVVEEPAVEAAPTEEEQPALVPEEEAATENFDAELSNDDFLEDEEEEEDFLEEFPEDKFPEDEL